MNTDTRQQIKTAIQAFSGSDLRAASIGPDLRKPSLQLYPKKASGFLITPGKFEKMFQY